MLVPDAEIVLEGSIGNETTMEGPFVDITGTYDLVREQPVIEFTGMHLKKDFIYHGILPGGNEHKMLMGAPYEPSIYRAVGGVTEVKNVVLTTGGCGYFHAVIQIRKQTQEMVKCNPCSPCIPYLPANVVVVDTIINPYDIQDVEFAIATRVRGDKSLLRSQVPGDHRLIPARQRMAQQSR